MIIHPAIEHLDTSYLLAVNSDEKYWGKKHEYATISRQL